MYLFFRDVGGGGGNWWDSWVNAAKTKVSMLIELYRLQIIVIVMVHKNIVFHLHFYAVFHVSIHN